MGFDEQPLKNMGVVLIIVGDEFTRLTDALKAVNDALVAEAVVGAKRAAETMADICDPIADLRKRIEEMHKTYAMGEFEDLAELAEEPADIPPPRKLPRPPKKTKPVNKANYTANRPPRVARSRCRTIRR